MQYLIGEAVHAERVPIERKPALRLFQQLAKTALRYGGFSDFPRAKSRDVN
jgi:hypothetical protein